VIIIILLGIVWLVFVLRLLLKALLVAALLAYLLDTLLRPLVQHTKITSTWGARLVYVIFILVLASIPAALGTMVVGQFQRIRAEFMVAVTALELWLTQPIDLFGFLIYPKPLLDYLEQAGGRVLPSLTGESFNILAEVTNNLLWGLAVLISLYYLLKDGPKIKLWVNRVCTGRIPG
jgi:predicted PurR-regulated permease PerM